MKQTDLTPEQVAARRERLWRKLMEMTGGEFTLAQLTEIICCRLPDLDPALIDEFFERADTKRLRDLLRERLDPAVEQRLMDTLLDTSRHRIGPDLLVSLHLRAKREEVRQETWRRLIDRPLGHLGTTLVSLIRYGQPRYQELAWQRWQEEAGARPFPAYLWESLFDTPHHEAAWEAILGRRDEVEGWRWCRFASDLLRHGHITQAEQAIDQFVACNEGSYYPVDLIREMLAEPDLPATAKKKLRETVKWIREINKVIKQLRESVAH